MIAPYGQPFSTKCRRWLFAAVTVGALAAGSVLAPPPAAAQSRDVQSLVTTIDRLERQLQALERTVYRGSPPPAAASGSAGAGASALPPAAASQLQLKTSQLEEQLRALTGQVEELGFQMSQVSERLDRLVADVDFRLRSLEGTGGQPGAAPGAPGPAASSSASPPVAPQPAPTTGGVVINREGAPGPSRVFGTLTRSQIEAAGVNPGSDASGGGATDTQQASAAAGDTSTLPPGSPEDRYNYARGFLMRRDFAGAEQALQAFVDTYPESELAGNAQYWLGETYYVREDFGAAARTFADGFQRYPDSSKAPDNLLKLGMSLAALDRIEDACITLSKLASEYPQSSASIRQRAERERARLKCQ